MNYAGGYTPFSVLRFGQKFVNEVANPTTVLNFFKKRAVGQNSSETLCSSHCCTKAFAATAREDAQASTSSAEPRAGESGKTVSDILKAELLKDQVCVVILLAIRVIIDY